MKKQNVQYVVDEKNRVIIATIEGCGEDAIDKINRKFINNVTSEIMFDWCAFDSYIRMPHKFKAVARCLPEDEWDVETGKRIACDKLTERYEKAMNRRMAKFMVDMDKMLTNLSKYLEGKEF